jgi:urea transporter
MTKAAVETGATVQPAPNPIPIPILVVFRGIGQVFFQENALTGALFVLAIAISSPLLAGCALVGSVIGSAVAWALKYDQAELDGGIFGFNATLVGIASIFFFPPGLAVISLMVVGCVVSTLLTRAMRLYVPFPTYTTPFIVTTWGVFFLAQAFGAVPDAGRLPLLVPNIGTGFYIESIANGIGQVMFQASIWTGLLFLVGIAVSDWRHALLVLIGAVVGTLVADYHFTLGADAIDPDRLYPRTAFDVIKLGLYGFNATLAPVALYLWRKSLIVPLLGMLLTVPLTELVPLLGLPALTFPFVLATWIVLALGRLEVEVLAKRAAAPS